MGLSFRVCSSKMLHGLEISVALAIISYQGINIHFLPKNLQKKILIAWCMFFSLYTRGKFILLSYLSNIFAPGIWNANARSSQIVLAPLLICDLLWQVGGTSLESFMIIGRVSSEAVLDAKRMSQRSFLNRLMIWMDEVMLEARFFSLKLMLCFMQLRKLLPS